MAWFKKKVSEEPIVEPSVPVVLTGTEPCSAHGCLAQNAALCAYIDRRQRSCSTAWCPEHQIVLDGKCYCRRHANTIDALGKLGETTYGVPLPDIGNRIPTLVRWVSIDLDEQIRALLDRLKRPDERFNREAVHSIHAIDGATHWILTWHLYDHTGSVLRISLEIDERDPVVVRVRVASKLIFSETPPWIEHRSKKEQIAPEKDIAERTAFYERIMEATTAEVQIARNRTHY